MSEKNKFDRWGLRHSSKHLLKTQGKIPFWNIHRQAEYADKTTVENIYNDCFVENQFSNICNRDENDFFNDFNTTAVGNIAYVALNANDFRIRIKAKQILKKYRIWYQNKTK